MAEPLITWYQAIRPRRIDLIGDYAGVEFFIVDGDSLLRWAFSDTRIDFGAGFQLLHAVFVVEGFLERLRGKRCNFAVVFFDACENTCIPSTPTAAANVWKYRFARTAILEHLLKAGKDGFVARFKSNQDEAFQRYFQKMRPYFIMCHDGEDIDANEKSEDAESTREALLGSLRQWMELGLNVVPITSYNYVHNKIFTTVLETTCTLSLTLLKSSPEPQSDDHPPPSEQVLLPDLISARQRLTVATISKALQEGNQDHLHSIFLLHTALLSHLSLPERCFPLSAAAKTAPELDAYLQAIIPLSQDLLATRQVSLDDATPDLHDFIDGRLLRKLVLMAPEPISSAVQETFTKLSESVASLCSTTLSFPSLTGTQTAFTEPTPEDDSDIASLNGSTIDGSTTVGSTISTSSSTATLTPRPTSLLPFSHPVLDPFLASLPLPDIAIAEEPANTEDLQVRENTTWQYAKKAVAAPAPKAAKKPSLGIGRLGKTVAPVGKGQQGDKLEKRAAGKVRRWEQVYLAQMNRYAASLTDSVDGSLNPKLIVAEEKGKKKDVRAEKVEEKPKGKKPAPGKKEVEKPKGKATGKLSAAEIIRQNNAAKKAGKEAKLQDFWNNFIRDLKKVSDDEEAVNKLDMWLRETQKTMAAGVAENLEWPFTETEARLYKLQLLQRIWTGFCRRGEQKLGYTVNAVLFDEARKILASPGLTQKVQSITANIFDSLGIIMPAGKPLKSLPDRKLGNTFDGVWTGKSEGVDIKLGMSSEEFQLFHCGPWMDRNMGSMSDDRVPFKPDKWQKDVLDELDGNNSVLVVAPTSAGKTFIAFYAMEKILKANDDDILVYIAPTKPLVSQIAAELTSRFKKNYRYAGKTVWAIDMGEYTMNKPKECQILITVPRVLQAMLMSPTNAVTWAPRVKRIIFDEVHSIGNAEDGAIWEQLLLMAPCPIIALTATVGNANEFNHWLETTQGALGVKLSMVQHLHRYSDLRKFVYLPEQNKTTFDGLTRVSRFKTMEFGEGMLGVHPVAALANARNGMQDDLALEPRDSLQLYWALVKAKTDQWPVDEGLDYKKVFGTRGGVIKKQDVVEWEAKLKDVVKVWMEDPASPFEKVVEILTKEKAGDQEVKTGVEETAVAKAETDADKKRDAHLHKTTLQLLHSLHNSNALPAILFNYDRESCEGLGEALCYQLEAAETKWRETNPKWTSTVKAWEAYMANKSARGAKVQKIAKPEAGQSKNDMMREAGELEGSYLDRFDPKYPSAEFSFADTKKQGNTELENDLSDLIKWGTPTMLVNAFKRGIGVHHSGLNRKYRQAVEMLFRKGYLRVVIATGELSLGINMPTRTAVFAGDSVELTALNYRQASGRAGRRGFDNIGNVVFHGLPLDKVDRLIASKLPPLLGHFPITTTLVLRMFILLHASKDSTHAKDTIESLLTQEQLVLDGHTDKEQVLHHLRFSIEFLRRQRVISATGAPLNFAGLVSHLYYTESGAFALHALLCSGYLQELCRDIYEKPDKTCHDLILVMAHLFGRRKRRAGIRGLPPIPASAFKVLQTLNNETLKTYTTYVETFAKGHRKTPETTLPFSGLSCGNSEEKPAHGPTARSAFVALSGQSDNFESLKDLITSVRDGIFPDGAYIPFIPIEEETPNGYIYDFYRHADVRKLHAENGIQPRDVWFVLRDFSVVLATVVPGLVSFLKDGPGAFYDLVREGGDEDGDLEEVEVNIEEREGEEEEMIKKSEGFGKVLKAFKVLRATYDEKFKEMWA